MFSLRKINIRRIASVFFLSAALFLNVALVDNQNAIAAESITRDATNLNSVDVVSDREYEMDKAERQQEQARRSAMATPDREDEGIVDKLNLNESLPRSTEKFAEQVAGDEPINNETRP